MIHLEKSPAAVLLTSAAALAASAPGAQAAPLQDIPVLPSQQQPQCTDIVDELPIISG
ncbi:hypothetical protein ACWDX6_27825 [Streptomyces sp. NPDC003027]